MKNLNKILIFLGGLVLLFGVPSRVMAYQTWCFCYSAISDQSPTFLYKNKNLITDGTCKQIDSANCNIKSQKSLFVSQSVGPSCDLIQDTAQDKTYISPILQNSTPPDGIYGKDRCNWFANEWINEKKIILASGSNTAQNATTQASGGKSTISTLITECGAADWKSLPAQCKDVTVFVKLALDIVDYMFAIIGALALVVFVYGGFVLIFSSGAEEKVKTGTGAMVNAVIGILVAFSGYALVSFLGYAFNLKESFQLFF